MWIASLNSENVSDAMCLCGEARWLGTTPSLCKLSLYLYKSVCTWFLLFLQSSSRPLQSLWPSGVTLQGTGRKEEGAKTSFTNCILFGILRIQDGTSSLCLHVILLGGECLPLTSFNLLLRLLKTVIRLNLQNAVCILCGIWQLGRIWHPKHCSFRPLNPSFSKFGKRWVENLEVRI